MSIDWEKIELRPEKKLPVEGRFLLDLRSKVNNLEKQLAQTAKDLDKTSTDLKSTKEKFSEVSKKVEEQSTEPFRNKKEF